ncbi:MAG: hypothetical protein KGN76_06100 [Acidobacteriota bacterium]|nr:hypothetical protein [Acidobacteriota bacterium]
MGDLEFRELLGQFLYDYWGAFHEAAEAQSVTADRLAGVLFERLRTAHDTFAARYTGQATDAVSALGWLWEAVDMRRTYRPDSPLKKEEIGKARRQFMKIYHDLIRQSSGHLRTVEDLVSHAPHLTPLAPWHVDAAS